MVTLQISIFEFGILKSCAAVFGTVSKTDEIGRYRYPLNILNFNAINAKASSFQKPAAVSRECAKCLVANSNLTQNITM